MAIWNERIRDKRIEKGITLAQIANALGVTEATAQRYESGSIKSVPYEHMCAYGRIFGCSPAYLMGWEKTVNSTNSGYLNLQYYEKKMLSSFSELNDANKRKCIAYTENLLSNQRMEEELLLNAAHKRTDIKVTDEMIKHDDDIMDSDDF